MNPRVVDTLSKMLSGIYFGSVRSRDAVFRQQIEGLRQAEQQSFRERSLRTRVREGGRRPCCEAARFEARVAENNKKREKEETLREQLLSSWCNDGEDGLFEE